MCSLPESLRIANEKRYAEGEKRERKRNGEREEGGEGEGEKRGTKGRHEAIIEEI